MALNGQQGKSNVYIRGVGEHEQSACCEEGL